MNKCVVIIPVHSTTPSALELISFKQCFKILGNHPIKIIAPDHLDLTEYKNAVPQFDVIFIDKIWQSNLLQYNKMKHSLFFYKLFTDFQYLLTYELDAFVFKDELLYWCNKNYDYVGAPWLQGYSDAVSGAEIIGVGNSGFSLRNVQSCIHAITTIAFKKGFFEITKDYLLSENKISTKLNPLNWLRVIYANSNIALNKTYAWNEDFYWSIEIPKFFKSFNIASPEEAIKFSMEVQPAYLYKINNNILPFGCHAWYRYDIEFWKPFISSFGYVI